jgi:hypothetical protein
LIAVEMGIVLDIHDRREAQSSLVERLAEVGAQHACEDPFVDGPEEFFIGFLVNVRGSIANDGGNLRIQSAPWPTSSTSYCCTNLMVLVMVIQGRSRHGLCRRDWVVSVGVSCLFHFSWLRSLVRRSSEDVKVVEVTLEHFIHVMSVTANSFY